MQLVGVEGIGSGSIYISEFSEDFRVVDIWLSINKDNWGPKPFRVLDCWFDNKDFVSFMEKEWTIIKVVGRSDFMIMEKLKILKASIKKWNYEVFDKVFSKLEENMAEINSIDALLGCFKKGEVEDLVTSISKGTSYLWRKLESQEHMLIQKSSLRWNRDGDLSSSFFHSVVKGR